MQFGQWRLPGERCYGTSQEIPDMATRKKSRKSFTRNRYTPQVRSAFLQAAREARAAGMSWAEAFKAARKAGYAGTRGGIEVLVRISGGKGPRKSKQKADSAVKKTSAASKRQDVDAVRVVGKRLRTIMAQAAGKLRRLAEQLESVEW
jgi:hypothetical protein